MRLLKIKKHHAYAAVFIVGTAITGFSLHKANAPNYAEEKRAAAVTYLDVRTKAEWETGHVNGAIHLDLQEIQHGRLPDMPKDSEIRVYCHSGKRAEIAKEILESNGFSKVENGGGYEGLASNGKKTCAGTLARCE